MRLIDYFYVLVWIQIKVEAAGIIQIPTKNFLIPNMYSFIL